MYIPSRFCTLTTSLYSVLHSHFFSLWLIPPQRPERLVSVLLILLCLGLFLWSLGCSYSSLLSDPFLTLCLLCSMLWKSDRCKLHFWIVLLTNGSVSSKLESGRKRQSRVFLFFFFLSLGQQFQLWLCLPHDSSFYWMSQFKSPAQGTLLALCSCSLWCVSLSSGFIIFLILLQLLCCIKFLPANSQV